VRGEVGAIAPARWLVSAMSAVLVLSAGTIVGTNLVTADPVPGASPITVTFNYNGATGGTSVTSATVTPGVSADSVLPFPTKSGLDFSGWFNTQSLLNGQRITTIGEGDTGELLAGFVPPELAQTLNLDPPVPPPTCANGLATCVVGDIGPAGGTIFYVNLLRAPGSQFWEVGSDMGTAPWGCYGTDITGTGTGIGAGATNTSLIKTGCVTAGIAARVASEPAGGYSDWFLPSLGELNQLCKYARNQSTSPIDEAVLCNNTGTLRAEFATAFADPWSSSQFSGEIIGQKAWSQSFRGSGQFKNSKAFPLQVRPVRSF